MSRYLHKGLSKRRKIATIIAVAVSLTVTLSWIITSIAYIIAPSWDAVAYTPTPSPSTSSVIQKQVADAGNAGAAIAGILFICFLLVMFRKVRW